MKSFGNLPVDCHAYASKLNERLDIWSTQQIALLDSLNHHTRQPSQKGIRVQGSVLKVNGILLECRLPSARIGDLCEIEGARGPILAEVVGFDDNIALLSALAPLEGVQTGASIIPFYRPHRIRVDDSLMGAVLDGFGRVLLSPSGTGAFDSEGSEQSFPVMADAPSPTKRPRITEPMPTGVRALDGFLTIGEGQRLGIFAGAGCGKTTLLAELARNMPCDMIVFGLIGERGRELREFLDHELDEELRSRCILVCATSDRSSMERARAAATATAIAEGFRAQGKKVLLLIDSLTRFARAQREIGLAAGEPPGRGGFPPSVYTTLPRLVERAGTLEGAGSITALYTVLIEGDVISGDPVADEVRSLLDGHIILSRKLAEQNHYPAIDVLGSISRTMGNVTHKAHITAAGTIRNLMSAYKEVEMLIRLGEYEPGHDPITDAAVQLQEQIKRFLRQDMQEPTAYEDSLASLQQLADMAPVH